MKTLSKKIFCYILVGLLSFSCVSSAYYKSSYAMEYVGGALAFEEALKWILACLGITATAGMTDAYWDSYGDDFVDYAIQDGCTQTQVAEWQMKACKGIIDKASDVWASFKAWAKSVITPKETDLPNLGSEEIASVLAPIMLAQSNTTGWAYTYNPGGHATQTTVKSAIMYYNTAYGTAYPNAHPYIYFFSNSNVDVSEVKLSGTDVYAYTSDGSRYRSGYWYQRDNYYNALNLDNWSSSYDWYGPGNADYSQYGCVTFNIDASSIPWGHYVALGTGASGNTSDYELQGIQNIDIDTLDIISSDLPDENSSEVTIPMPGIADSDDEASADAYDEIIDAINNGEISIEKGIEDIQALLHIIVYDTETDDIIPIQTNPDTGENKKKEDEIAENKNNMSFTLAGLENVFPFCIPWDIYAFMTLLVAEPEAPEFDYPIQSVNNRVEVIHIDLSPFEPVAVVVRYIFDFLFIVGLAMLTRSLIGGGGSE